MTDNKNELTELMISIGKKAKEASSFLALATPDMKNAALRLIAESIHRNRHAIQSHNKKDLDLATKNNLTPAFIDRLTLTDANIDSMINGIDKIVELDDPVGNILDSWERPNGLFISQIRVPLGVIGVIYESRPNVTADAAGLCIKSGNAVILRGGKESFYTSNAIFQSIQEGLERANFPIATVQMVPTCDRDAIDILIKLDQYVDVLIPRGGPGLIKHLMAESRIPLFKHLAGICHTYIHTAADKTMSKEIVLNAKMRRTGICGATEVLLIDEAVVESHLPSILSVLFENGCEIRGDDKVRKLDTRVNPIDEHHDYDTEFLDAIIAVKIVNNITMAISHIAQHGTQHTDAIITQDNAAAELFMRQVDSAIVIHNASTQFADGGEFGMGAEIGIATGKLHARGPVGVVQLTTFKYQVRGNGQIRPK